MTSAVQRPLPLHPQPLPDEWLGSYVYRLAVRNGISTAEVAAECQMSVAEMPDAEVVSRLAHLGSCPESRLRQAMNLPASLITRWGRVGGVSPHPFFSVRYCQVCPECLSSDPVPYFRLAWLSDTTGVCLVHGTSLFDACPHCEARIMPAGDRTRTSRRELHVQPHEQDDLRRCWDCQGDLAFRVSTDVPIFAPLRLLAPPSQLKRNWHPTPDRWTALVSTLRRYISVFGLYRVYHAETDTFIWSPLPMYFPESHRQRARHRFLTEQLLVSVVCGREAASESLHSRLQRFARFILSPHDLTVTRDFPETRLQIHRFWVAQQLCDSGAYPQNLLQEWVSTTQRLLDLNEGSRPDPRLQLPSGIYSLTEEQRAILSPLMTYELDVDRGKGSQQVLDLFTLFSTMLWRLATGRGAPDLRHADHLRLQIVQYHQARWIDQGRLGVMLGALYHHHQSHPELQRGESWWTNTEAIFESDGVIELSRRVNPALHRVLLKRLLR